MAVRREDVLEVLSSYRIIRGSGVSEPLRAVDVQGIADVILEAATPAADADMVRIAVSGLERIKAYRVCKESANIWTGASACRAIADETLAALKSAAAPK